MVSATHRTIAGGLAVAVLSVVSGTMASSQERSLAMLPESNRASVSFGDPIRLESTGDLTITGASRVYWNGKRYIVSLLQSGYRWAEFDDAGELIRVFGSRGDGPGEYRSIQLVVPLGSRGRLVFHDSRYTVLRDGLPVSSRLFVGLVLGAFPHAAGGATVLVLKPERGGEQLYDVQFDQLGKVVAERQIHLDEGFSPSRVAYDGRESFYVLDSFNYRIAVVDTTGAVTGYFARDASWFQGPTKGDDGGARPRTISEGIFHDGENVWVVFAVQRKGAEYGGFRSLQEFAARYHFRLEVFNPTSGKVIISQSYDMPPILGAVLGENGLAYTLEEDEAGLVSIVVRRPLVIN